MNTQQQMVYQCIEQRLVEIFTAYKQGQDVSPARRFHLEGYVQACCELQLISIEQALKLMADTYTGVFAEPFDVERQCEQQQAFVIPALMKRAPVYPST